MGQSQRRWSCKYFLVFKASLKLRSGGIVTALVVSMCILAEVRLRQSSLGAFCYFLAVECGQRQFFPLKSRSFFSYSSLFLSPISLLRILSLVDVQCAMLVAMSGSSVNQADHSSNVWHVCSCIAPCSRGVRCRCELTSCDESRGRS